MAKENRQGERILYVSTRSELASGFSNDRKSAFRPIFNFRSHFHELFRDYYMVLSINIELTILSRYS